MEATMEGYVSTKEMIQMLLNAMFDDMPEDREEVDVMRDFVGVMLQALASAEHPQELNAAA
jgi:hypothetical protein